MNPLLPKSTDYARTYSRSTTPQQSAVDSPVFLMPKQAKNSRNLTMEQRCAIVQHHLQHPKMKHAELAAWVFERFKLVKAPDRTTILKILQDKDRFTAVNPQDKALKRARSLLHPELDTATANRVLQMEH
jgi:hypothetical protein